MKRWLRRFSYLVIVIVWLAVMIFPFLAFTLANQGEIQFGDPPGQQVRLFLVQEKAAEGVGLEWTRPYRGQPDCAKSNISFFLWEGEGENAEFCQCTTTSPDNPADCSP